MSEEHSNSCAQRDNAEAGTHVELLGHVDPVAVVPDRGRNQGNLGEDVAEEPGGEAECDYPTFDGFDTFDSVGQEGVVSFDLELVHHFYLLVCGPHASTFLE